MSSDVYTASIVIRRQPDEVLAYVRVPEHQPEWAVNFVRSTRPIGGGTYEMETPFGRLTYRVEADEARGTVDFLFDGPGGKSVLPTRVTPHPLGSVYTFTITRRPGTPDPVWEKGKRGMDEELAVLKRIVEAAS